MTRLTNYAYICRRCKKPVYINYARGPYDRPGCDCTQEELRPKQHGALYNWWFK